MDIQLPDVNGLEVTKWLKDDQNLKSIPFVAVSAFSKSDDEDKIRKSCCNAYIFKPISVPKFLQTIENLLAESHRSVFFRRLRAFRSGGDAMRAVARNELSTLRSSFLICGYN